MSSLEELSSVEQQQQQQDEVMKLTEFTREPPAHHHPNDHKLPVYDDEDEEWLLAEPSGFTTSLPNNIEWPVTERLVFPLQEPFPPQEEYTVRSQQILSSNDSVYTALVTGSSGAVGSRLVSMLVQRGATKVVAVDIVEPSETIKAEHIELLGEDKVNAVITYATGTIENAEFIIPLLDGITVIYNCAALVDPYNHPQIAYTRVNHHAVDTLIKLAKEQKVKKFVHLSSPETRLNFDKEDKDFVNQSEDQLDAPLSFEYVYVPNFAKTKALGEKIVLEHNDVDMLTCCVAPATLYGPRDEKFLPPIIKAALNNDLRIVGDGKNKISVCYVDNAAHAMIQAANKMKQFDVVPAGNFYLITDDYDHYLYGLYDDIIIRGGLPSISTRLKAPGPVAKTIGFLNQLIKPSSKLNPYTITCMENSRTFNISKAKEELGYVPLVPFQDAWLATCKAQLTQFELPIYNTKFYYEGLPIDIDLELKKVEEEEKRREQAFAEREALKALEAQDAKEEPEPAPVIEEAPAPAPVIEAPVVEEAPAPAPVIEEAPVIEAPVVEEAPAPVVEEAPAPAPVIEAPVIEEAPAPVVEEAPAPVIEEIQEPESPTPEGTPKQQQKGKKGKKGKQ